MHIINSLNKGKFGEVDMQVGTEGEYASINDLQRLVPR
jgi:hypothetical protein